MRAPPLVTLWAVLAGACAPDPVHDAEVARLGPEDGLGPSQYHRPGQPCGACHGERGPAATAFSMAGTIFERGDALRGAADAVIGLVDARGTSPPREVRTNCAGNFWVLASDWTPEYPVRVVVRRGASERAMRGAIGRASSCASCHDPWSARPLEKAGPIVVDDAAAPTPETKCPVEPTLVGAP